MTSSTEHVVLLNNDFQPMGTADKATIHNENTPLHLAFSCYLWNTRGQVLVTRRSLDKIAWPGVWTNSFCGHPLPNEEFSDAVQRRAQYELGATATDIQCICPDFQYLARDDNGIVENEFCPVFQARLTSPLAPRASEVADYAWVDFDDLLVSVQNTPFAFSPWMCEQLANSGLVTHIKQGFRA
ncbi:isopentenyl-diphosphate Delta-isomerase [Vibrio zhugei]|uniref:Isopentenyl-diphosphate Delta-isomerase n=1 Tax=Vibrio zhugei TaxID=2479546 RepID=A0ABV7C964_9VIBR|nr:isopentenyl-diphosphate Delta-isomerase [Vibrio zhugei]